MSQNLDQFLGLLLVPVLIAVAAGVCSLNGLLVLWTPLLTEEDSCQLVQI